MAPAELPFEELPVLETDRLVLRRTTVADAPAYLAMRQANVLDPATSRFLLRGAPDSLEDARVKLEEMDARFREGAVIPWTVTLRGSDVLLGVVGFVRWARDDCRSEAMWELDPRQVGKGYVTEALPAVIAFGFDVMGLHRVEAHIDPRNTRSIRVAERLGFEREGVLRENVLGPQGFLDSAIYARLNGLPRVVL